MEDKMNDASPSENFFLESARVHGNLYGTSFEAVRRIHARERICLLDVDMNGVIQIKNSGLHVSSYVFIAPPSLDALKQRLSKRGTETSEQLSLRLKNSENELEYGLKSGNFDLVLVNDDLELSIQTFKNYLGSIFPELKS